MINQEKFQKCDTCGAYTPAIAIRCLTCGVALSAQKPKSVFCVYCGAACVTEGPAPPVCANCMKMTRAELARRHKPRPKGRRDAGTRAQIKRDLRPFTDPLCP